MGDWYASENLVTDSPLTPKKKRSIINVINEYKFKLLRSTVMGYVKYFFKLFVLFSYAFGLIMWSLGTKVVGAWLTRIFGEPLAVVVYVVVLCAGFAGITVYIKYMLEN